MLKILKKTSIKAWSVARRLFKPWYIVVVVCAMAVFFVLNVIADRKINEHLPAAVDYVEKTTGLRCDIQELTYVFPNGLRAHNVRLSDDEGRQWLHASSITARVSLFNYLVTGKIGRHLVKGFDARNLELTAHHKMKQGWQLPERRKSSVDHDGSVAESEEAPIDVNVDHFTINFQTEKNTVSRAYKKMTARIDRKKGFDSLKIAGDGERFSFLAGKTPGEFDLQADSFGLAILAPLTGNAVPLDDLYVNAHANGKREEGGDLSFSLSGDVASLKEKASFFSFLETKANIIGFHVTGKKNDSRITMEKGQISVGGESLLMDGWISNKKNPEINMMFTFPEFSIGKAVSALPRSFHRNLEDLKVKGSLAGKFHVSMDMEKPRSLKYHYEGKYEPVKIISLGSKINSDALKSPFQHTLRTPGGKKITFLVGESNPRYVPLRNIPESMISAVITAEDGGFYSHKGFSERQMRNSFVENLEAGRIVRGASTITMQLAKNLFLSPERTFSRKFEEMFITMMLEQNLPKGRLMEIYLNIIEWGDGLYGIGPAARYYFNKSPGELKPVESAFLASIIARPRKHWQPDPLSKIGEGWWRYLHVILCKMYEKGGADIEDLREAGVPEERIRELAGDDIEGGVKAE